MAFKAQQATGCAQITVLADRGYFNRDQVLACEGTGVAPVMPKTLTSGNTKRGLFTGQDFIYDAEKDHYTCPAGQHVTRGHARSDRSGDIDHYRHLTACFTCPLKPRCTADTVKRVKRWKHEGVLDAMRIGSTACPRPWACDARPSNIRSGPSRPGWAPPTS